MRWALWFGALFDVLGCAVVICCGLLSELLDWRFNFVLVIGYCLLRYGWLGFYLDACF